VQVEGFGGSIPSVAVSAKTGAGVKELLDTIMLVAEMKELKNEPDAPLEAVVIENRIDKGKGLVATIVVKKGTLKFGSPLFDGDKQVAKVRAMFDENRVAVVQAGPSKPVEVLGFTSLPQVGAVLTTVAVPKAVVEVVKKELDAAQSVADFLANMNGKKKLAVIIKADVYGSLEAILEALGDYVDIVTAGVGEISDADVLMAKSTGAFVIGFNVKLKTEIEKLAQIEGVICRTYTIIYELLDELHDVIEGAMEVITKERELGKGRVLAEFPFNGVRIAGIKVMSGRIAKGDQVKVMRGEEEIGKAKIKSVRHGKAEETRMDVGDDCGLLFDRVVDFAIGDDIIAFTNH
jgi:translation initiation factor IF-2